MLNSRLALHNVSLIIVVLLCSLVISRCAVSQNVDFFRFDLDANRSLRTPRQEPSSGSINDAKMAPSSSGSSIQTVATGSPVASAPLFQPINNDLPSQFKFSEKDKEAVDKATTFTNSLLERLGLASNQKAENQKEIRRHPAPAFFQTDDLTGLGADLASNRIDLQIPVPGFAGPQDAPTVPGVNTIPGLSNFNYIVGQLVPQMIPPTNTLLGSSISRLLPKDATKNLAKNVFRAVHPAAENVDVARMMGRWFQKLPQVITSPHVIREACTVSHFGALTNNTYSATFTILKFYREGNSNGPPRFSLGYGFKAGDTGQFLLHSSNSPDV
uniref:Uncharacterized protein n=1 Tax=Meloidogyne hapla TaxID=6305 RepID=A0A1I8AYV8_MELHA